jgi:membrane protease YdiL (CAAX protease family)
VEAADRCPEPAQSTLTTRRCPQLQSFALALSSDQAQAVQLLIILLAVVTILVAANLGEKSEGWRIAAYALTITAATVVTLLALLTVSLVAIAPGAAETTARNAGVSVSRLALGGGLELLAGVAAGLALLPAVRQAVARVAPTFRSDSSINAVGLALYLLTLLFYISIQVSSDQLKQLAEGGQSPSVVFIISTNQLPFLVVALAGVGLFTRRGVRQTLLRLGLYWPGWGWIAASIGVAVGLVIFGTFFDTLMTHLTPEQSRSIQQVSNQLLKNVNSLVPAIAIALAAGIGEEILFRGALLPRLGNPAAALLFAVLHAQYAISLATLEIFILGLVLGMLRRRAGTTAAIVAHTSYDMILLLISLYVH